MARLDFKASDETKELLAQAAALSGTGLTAFVLNSATERAREVLAEHAQLKLSAEAHARFMLALSNPEPPSDALKELLRLPDLPRRR